MNEPAEITAENARLEAAHALLLTRILATVGTIVIGLSCLFAASVAVKFGVMFSEIGASELPVLSALVVRHSGIVAIGVLVLTAVTLFFVWSKGRIAAWMAGIGLLLLAGSLPLMLFAMFLPLVRITTEMGNP